MSIARRRSRSKLEIELSVESYKTRSPREMLLTSPLTTALRTQTCVPSFSQPRSVSLSRILPQLAHSDVPSAFPAVRASRPVLLIVSPAPRRVLRRRYVFLPFLAPGTARRKGLIRDAMAPRTEKKAPGEKPERKGEPLPFTLSPWPPPESVSPPSSVLTGSCLPPQRSLLAADARSSPPTTNSCRRRWRV